MSVGQYAKVYGAAFAVFIAMDLLWLGLVARGFYARQFAPLMRPDTQWLPAIAFYFIYVAAVVALCALPAFEKHSLQRALTFGALFGLAAYAAFDLVGLALIRDFPRVGALVDMTWGAVITATVSAVGYWVATRVGPA